MTAPASPPDIAPNIAQLLDRYAPDVSGAISDFHQEIWRTVDPVLLELARLRIAMLLDDASALARRAPAQLVPGLDEAKLADLGNWPSSPRFTELERACLALTEQFVGDVANVQQEDVDAVLAHLSPAQCYSFVMALLALDEHQRLSLAMRRVFGTTEETA